MHCSENRFCSSLRDETREQLCRHCRVVTFAAGTETSVNFNTDYIVIEGLCVIRSAGHLALILRPGDYITPPLPNEDTADFPDFFTSSLDVVRKANISFITDTVWATFRKEDTREMMEDPTFLRVLYENRSACCARLVAWQLSVFQAPVYDALRYVLRYCKANGYNRLTHAELALLTGHSRTTITEAMHQIALSEPDCL